MPFDVATGGDKALVKRKETEFMALKLGIGRMYIPLNGGSQTRRDIREYWVEWARDHNIAVKTYGHAVILGDITNA